MPHNVYDTILGTIGNTPLVRLNRITREVAATVYAKVETVQPRQQHQGPDGRADDRGGRAQGAAQARRHDHRGHQRQYRHGARHRCHRQGLQVHLHHYRQAVEGEGGRAAGVRRRGDRVPHRRRSRGSAILLLGVVPARRRDAQRVEGQPVRQPQQLAGSLRDDRARRSGSRPRARSIIWWWAWAPAAPSAAPASS